MATMTPTPPGWYVDPMHRHEFRYWDSHAWTADVSDRGIQSSDALTAVAAPVVPAADLQQAQIPTVATPALMFAPIQATQTPAVGAPGVMPPPMSMTAVGGREIVVPNGRRFYVGSLLASLGTGFYLVLAAFGWFLGLGSASSNTAPIVYLGSRPTGLGTEYFVPGLAFVLLAFVVMGLAPRMVRKLKNRQSREFLTQQLGMSSSWKYTTAYVAKSFRWRRIASTIGAAAMLAAALVTAIVISGEGFSLAFGAYALIALGAVALVGMLILLSTPYQRVHIEADGRVLEPETQPRH